MATLVSSMYWLALVCFLVFKSRFRHEDVGRDDIWICLIIISRVIVEGALISMSSTAHVHPCVRSEFQEPRIILVRADKNTDIFVVTSVAHIPDMGSNTPIIGLGPHLKGTKLCRRGLHSTLALILSHDNPSSSRNFHKSYNIDLRTYLLNPFVPWPLGA
jgi:hypothetical protein